MLKIFVVVFIVTPSLGLEFSVSSLWDCVQQVSSSTIDVSKNLFEATADSIQNVNHTKIYNDEQKSIGSNLQSLKQYGSQSITQMANVTLTKRQKNQIFDLIDGNEQQLIEQTPLFLKQTSLISMLYIDWLCC